MSLLYKYRYISSLEIAPCVKHLHRPRTVSQQFADRFKTFVRPYSSHDDHNKSLEDHLKLAKPGYKRLKEEIANASDLVEPDMIISTRKLVETMNNTNSDDINVKKNEMEKDILQQLASIGKQTQNNKLKSGENGLKVPAPERRRSSSSTSSYNDSLLNILQASSNNTTKHQMVGVENDDNVVQESTSPLVTETITEMKNKPNTPKIEDLLFEIETDIGEESDVEKLFNTNKGGGNRNMNRQRTDQPRKPRNDYVVLKLAKPFTLFDEKAASSYFSYVGKKKKVINDSNSVEQVVDLSFMEKLQAHEKDMLCRDNPRNFLDLMADWTEEGKLWHFPIDNFQGVDQISEPFHAHVFLERHLEEWCPKTGPLKQFMELVCVGLQRNAWLTVKEKHDHLEWFKQYFTSCDRMDLFNNYDNSAHLLSVAA